jgi:hypothetical protein
MTVATSMRVPARQGFPNRVPASTEMPGKISIPFLLQRGWRAPVMTGASLAQSHENRALTPISHLDHQQAAPEMEKMTTPSSPRKNVTLE